MLTAAITIATIEVTKAIVITVPTAAYLRHFVSFFVEGCIEVGWLRTGGRRVSGIVSYGLLGKRSKESELSANCWRPTQSLLGVGGKLNGYE